MVTIRLEGISKTFSSSQAETPVPHGRALGWLGLALGGRTRQGPLLAPARGVQALSDVNLTVCSGETVGVVGPSGCGKTTLLRIIAGLERPDRGRIFYDDVDVANLPPSERGIGMVFQNYALYPHMVGKGNLAFYFQMHHREAEIEERVRITSQLLGVGFNELLDKKPPKLSSGQQQRVAIGRCIIRDPSIFLFDEPLANVDAKIRVQTRVVIKRLLYRFAITSLYVTHDQTEAITLGDRLAVMRAGRIEQVGTFAEICERPANKFVGGFLGLPPLSFLTGTLAERALLLPNGSALPLPDHLAGLAPAGARLSVGVRAQDVRLGDPVADEGLRGIVEVVETLPSERHQMAHVKVGGTTCLAQIPREDRLRPGYVVSVSFVPEHLYLFDEASEQTIWPRAG